MGIGGADDEDVFTLNGWCDSKFGWGPTVPDGSALTMCFCSTVFELPSACLFLAFGAPLLIKTIFQPLVKPAFACRYYVKLLASLLCLGCSIILALLADPPSTAVRLSLTMACLGWVVSLALLIAGHYRHLPQSACVRIWWVGQFATNVIIFLMHGELQLDAFVHMVRGVYCCTCVLLALLSSMPMDQPRYHEVTIQQMLPVSNSPRLRQRPINVHTPLLVPGIATRVEEASSHNSIFGGGRFSSSAPTRPSSELERMSIQDSTTYEFFDENSSDEDLDCTTRLSRKLSSNLLFSGATTSKYAEPLMVWQEALHSVREGGQQQQGSSESDEENQVDDTWEVGTGAS